MICFWRDESGASATEYALTLAIIGACIMLMAIGLGYAIGGAMNSATTCIEGHNGACREMAGAEPIPAAATTPTSPSAANPSPGADPTPSSENPGKGKPKKPKKGCPTWGHCKR